MTARDAKRAFALILREVEQSESITVTSRGRPVAIIEPAEMEQFELARAKQWLVERLPSRTVTGERGWARGDLYD